MRIYAGNPIYAMPVNRFAYKQILTNKKYLVVAYYRILKKKYFKKVTIGFKEKKREKM